MDEYEIARQKEQKEQRKYFLYAFVCVVVLFGFYVVIFSDKLSVLGVELTGYAISVWLIAMVLSGGVAVSFLIISLSSLYNAISRFSFSIMKRRVKPLVTELVYILVAIALFSKVESIHFYIAKNQNDINMWYYNFTDHRQGLMTIVTLITYLIGLYTTMFVFGFLGSLLHSFKNSSAEGEH